MVYSTRLFSEHRADELRRLFEDSEGTDVHLVCGGMTREVHSVILRLGSKVLGTMCSGSFQEGLSGRIELKEHEPHLVYRMLQHLYMIDYSGNQIEIDGKKEESFVSVPHTHAMMYAMGDEYDIKDLKEEALWKFNKAIANKGQSDVLASVAGVIPTVYATTPDSDRGIRDAVVAFGAKNLAEMKDLPDFKNAVTQAPTYIIEMLPGFFHRLEDGRRRYIGQCPNCANVDEWMFNSICCCACGEYNALYGDDLVDAS